MRTTFIDRQNMVNFIDRNVPTIFEASFTQGMVSNIKLSNLTPMPTVMLFMIAAMLFIILAAGYCFMRWAVATFADGSRASGVRTGF
jgi:hypothetical protein